MRYQEEGVFAETLAAEAAILAGEESIAGTASEAARRPARASE